MQTSTFSTEHTGIVSTSLCYGECIYHLISLDSWHFCEAEQGGKHCGHCFLSLALTPEAPRSLRWGMGDASVGQLPLHGHRQDGNGNERPCGCDVHARPFLFAGSYYLTTTYGALEHIKNYDKITVTRQLSVEVQDSIHRWERRRTLNKARASRSSVQVPSCVTGKETAWQMDGLCPYLLVLNVIIILRQNQLKLLLKRRVHSMQAC